MKTKTKSILGNVLNYFLSFTLIVSGSMKIIGVSFYSEMINELSPHFFENITLIGVVTILCGILFLIPRTFTLGFSAVLLFFGGTIAAHMGHGDPYIVQVLFAILAMLTAYLKQPQLFQQVLHA